MKKLLYAALLLGAVLSVARAKDPIPQLNKLRMAEQAIARLYVDSVDEDKLVEDAIRGMLEKLDPHSEYSTPEETRELNEPLQGSFSGIGISFNLNNDTVYVLQTIANGPSEKVGILAGDRIISVNDTAIAGVKLKRNEIIKKLRGPKGSEVNLGVIRRTATSVPDTIHFKVTRDDIPIKSVDAAYLVNDSVGYVRLNKFAADTGKEFRESLKPMKKKGMKHLILDLSDNGGGYLNAAVDVLGELLDPGALAVYTEGNSSPRYDHHAFPAGFISPLLSDGRLVVMATQLSASASEITAGAVQDWDRGLIVGRRTYGKGLVQRPIPFPDGSMMRLTIAHYYTPAGRDIQKPYEKGKQEDYDRDLVNRLKSGELMHADSIHHVDSLKLLTLKNQRPIYGGGGIFPDFFVPLDTMEYTKYYRQVVAKGILNKAVIEYVDNNRKALKQLYKNDTEFIRNFVVPESLMQRLLAMAEDEKIEFNQAEYERSRGLFELIMKAVIGRDIFEDQTYFKVYNTHDPVFRKALEVITGPDYDAALSSSDEGEAQTIPGLNSAGDVQ